MPSRQQLIALLRGSLPQSQERNRLALHHHNGNGTFPDITASDLAADQLLVITEGEPRLRKVAK